MRFWKTQSSRERIENALRRLGQPYQQIGPGRWEAKWKPLKGYLVSIQAWEFPDRFELMAFSDVVIQSEWFERGMAIWLLQENDKLRVGSLRLIDTREGLILANGRICPYPLYDEAELANTVAELVSESLRTLQKLLAMEFIYPRTEGDSTTVA